MGSSWPEARPPSTRPPGAERYSLILGRLIPGTSPLVVKEADRRVDVCLHLIEPGPLVADALGGLGLHRGDPLLHGLDLVAHQAVHLGAGQRLRLGHFLPDHRLESLGDGLVQIASHRQLRGSDGAADLGLHVQLLEARHHPPDELLELTAFAAGAIERPRHLVAADRPAAQQPVPAEREIEVGRPRPGHDAEREPRDGERGQLDADESGRDRIANARRPVVYDRADVESRDGRAGGAALGRDHHRLPVQGGRRGDALHRRRVLTLEQPVGDRKVHLAELH